MHDAAASEPKITVRPARRDASAESLPSRHYPQRIVRLSGIGSCRAVGKVIYYKEPPLTFPRPLREGTLFWNCREYRLLGVFFAGN